MKSKGIEKAEQSNYIFFTVLERVDLPKALLNLYKPLLIIEELKTFLKLTELKKWISSLRESESETKWKDDLHTK